jgi:hypothetical protein
VAFLDPWFSTPSTSLAVKTWDTEEDYDFPELAEKSDICPVPWMPDDWNITAF